MIHVFILIVTIAGEVQSESCDQALCFRSLNDCNWYAANLRTGNSPSTTRVTAYCKPILVDQDQEGVRIY